MAETLQVNRSLKDRMMDQIDHALGRPLDPTAETCRNFYAVSGPTADEMAASPFWVEGRRQTDMRYFAVTDEGRNALAAHLRKVADPHRAFTIRFDGHERTVVHKTASKARYDYFLILRDIVPDMTFADYCRRVSVRRCHSA